MNYEANPHPFYRPSIEAGPARGYAVGMKPTKSQPAGASAQFAADVRSGLGGQGQKSLPSKYLYDELGVKIFEAIRSMPEYGVTAAEERLLNAHAAEIAGRVEGDAVLAELGSGARRFRRLLEAFSKGRAASYCPIESSPAALSVCRSALSGLDAVRITGLQGDYLEGLSQVAKGRRTGERLVVMLLGGTLESLDGEADQEFLKSVSGLMRKGDHLLLGTDLEKPIAKLMGAYADPLGLGAAFNLNALARMNRELGADFDLARFEHFVRFNVQARRVELHLRCKRAQAVRIPKAGLNVAFAPGETLWTESSRKYAPEKLAPLLSGAGFRLLDQWIDREWPFAASLVVHQ